MLILVQNSKLQRHKTKEWFQKYGSKEYNHTLADLGLHNLVGHPEEGGGKKIYYWESPNPPSKQICSDLQEIYTLPITCLCQFVHNSNKIDYHTHNPVTFRDCKAEIFSPRRFVNCSENQAAMRCLDWSHCVLQNQVVNWCSYSSRDTCRWTLLPSRSLPRESKLVLEVLF